ncbi:hypothetical protein ACN42_g7645 [Penicillium freii]|uniref:Uncharacterized protein n=1 Tax=Penicillium freii TaxID=48697 RepID=A0A117NMN7_PENFR|nr:hypothetical protein ACN42_g7645 [Penicillium freii]
MRSVVKDGVHVTLEKSPLKTLQGLHIIGASGMRVGYELCQTGICPPLGPKQERTFLLWSSGRMAVFFSNKLLCQVLKLCYLSL